jgi:hypothetical protein
VRCSILKHSVHLPVEVGDYEPRCIRIREETDYHDCGREVLGVPQLLQTVCYRDCAVLSARCPAAANPSLEIWAYSRAKLSCLIIYFMFVVFVLLL